MNARGVIVVLALCLFTSSVPMVQAADGWFGDSSTSAGGSSSSKKATKSSWFSWPYGRPKAPAARNKPSMFDNMARSTKKTWNKTVSFLNPFDNPPTQKPNTSSSPNTGSWFPSLQSNKKPETVPEWLDGEMPKF